MSPASPFSPTFGTPGARSPKSSLMPMPFAWHHHGIPPTPSTSFSPNLTTASASPPPATINHPLPLSSASAITSSTRPAFLKFPAVTGAQNPKPRKPSPTSYSTSEPPTKTAVSPPPPPVQATTAPTQLKPRNNHPALSHLRLLTQPPL